MREKVRERVRESVRERENEQEKEASLRESGGKRWSVSVITIRTVDLIS